MTNKQRYKRTFSALHASKTQFRTEETAMKRRPERAFARLVPALAALVLVLGLTSAACAADLGHIRRKLQIWIRGDQTEAVMEIREGSYTLTYEDGNGESRQQSGGGVAIGPDGTERPVTEEEILEYLDAPDVEYLEDGSVWIWYRGQSLDITDRFEDGVCYVKLAEPDRTLYVTVKYGNGYAYGTDAYIQPWTFN